ncbi:hypothetical protein AYI69_g6582 [Smittium culicis]|uniref:Uncharacterized protein n=1 Tax=Smittium culicis TaxID=133412 RepID=A0A1R1XXY7_9FUNG|nr:hypothetical protein AYI69_g9509 [Smittium culicis]OMJ19543.1 hypothetical protein AYI69_g6582 [Smittium culicis]
MESLEGIKAQQYYRTYKYFIRTVSKESYSSYPEQAYCKAGIRFIRPKIRHTEISERAPRHEPIFFLVEK